MSIKQNCGSELAVCREITVFLQEGAVRFY